VDKEPLRQTFAEILKQISAETVEAGDPEKLQRDMAARGIKPEDNIFSSGIIEMREE
jgi:hypothetical protein